MVNGNKRNLPCKCGSGKKYKKCCMEKEEQKIENTAGVLYGPIKAGVEDDFYNRFLFQITEIRSFVVPREKRIEFDKDYNSLFQNLIEAKFAKEFCFKYISEHKENINTGKDGIIQGHQLNINNPIDIELNLFFKDFFIRGTMAIESLQNILRKWFGYNITFLFTDKEKDFEKGAKNFKLKKDDPRFENLALFIKSNREGWYSDFKNLRNDIEHQGYKLPQIKHAVVNGKVLVNIPKYKNNPIEEMLNIEWVNLSGLCEEILVFIMSLELPKEYIIWKIPEEKRPDFFWSKYKVAIPDFPEAKVSTS